MHSRQFAAPPMPNPEPSCVPRPGPVLEDLRQFVAWTFRGGDETGLGHDTPLVTSGIVDSVGVLELVDFMESRFGVRVPPGDVVLEHFDSLARLRAYLQAAGVRDDCDG